MHKVNCMSKSLEGGKEDLHLLRQQMSLQQLASDACDESQQGELLLLPVEHAFQNTKAIKKNDEVPYVSMDTNNMASHI